jgi:hypothetical protein
MSQYLNLYFSTKYPDFKTFFIEVPNSIPNNYTAYAFFSTPIYNSEFNKKIGYKVSDDYIQQVSENEYSVTINNTYHIDGHGTISWQYAFINNKPTYYYPIGVSAISNIVSTTGSYYGKTDVVSLMQNEDGTRNVTIGFNF